MAFNTNQQIQKYEKRNRQRRVHRRVLCALCFVVAAGTAYGLIHPAVAEGRTAYCGIEEHVHTQETCYEQRLVCGMEEGELPAAEAEAEKTLICGVTEGEGAHTHSDECYTTETVLTCDLEESDGHTHDESCYDENGELTCGMEEGEDGHTHTDECYTEQRTLTCGLEENPGHIHTDDCYTEQSVPDGEEAGHIHSEECYEYVLTCTQAEHTHTTECFMDPDAEETGDPAEDKQDADSEAGSESGDGSDPAADTENAKQPSESETEPVTGDGQTIPTAGDEQTGQTDQETEDGQTEPATNESAGGSIGPLVVWDGPGMEDVELTGDYALDLLAIAQTQLGYTEQPDGYTKYGDWYGIPYGDWCAMFVSYCLNYAGISQEVIPYAASCPAWVAELQALGQYAPAEEYSPREGDLIFFDWNGDGSADHVGIVYARTLDESWETEDGSYPIVGIQTIEGNSGDAVRKNEYTIPDPRILGYGFFTENENAGLIALDGESYTLMEESVSLCAYRCAYDKDAETSQKVGYYVIADMASVTRAELDSVYQQDGSFQEKAEEPTGVADRLDSAYFLIPVRYFEENYGQCGYAFDPAADADTCPIFYTDSYPDVTYKSNSSYLHTAEYRELEGGDWYVRVKGVYNNGWVCYVYYAALEKATDAVSPSSTIIHVFDYWTTPNRTDSDNHISTSADMEGGINNGHALKFGKNIPLGYGDINYSWGGTNTPSKVTQGIVLPNLGSDGYPQLSGTTTEYMRDASNIQDCLTAESLAYLFDPSVQVDGKASFANVTGLLWRDSQGYLCYDSEKRGVELDETTCAITEYATPVGYYWADGKVSRYGQFFPFNDAHQTALNDADDDPANHYFGMTLTTRFIQQYEGYEAAEKNQPMTFEFAGDNDVWIYIDGVLVADLGGLRSAASVTINFATGVVQITDGASNPGTTIRAAFEAAGKSSMWDWSGDTFPDDSTHTLKFYYLERGNYDSNIALKYNLNEIPPTSLYKVDQYGEKPAGAGFAVYTTDGGYLYKTTAGNYVALNGEEPDAATGVIVTERGETIQPAYVGVTNSSGDMVFADRDGIPYSISELTGKLGDRFILREISIPEGFRTVTDEVRLRIDGGVIVCEEPYKSGVWASPNAQITAAGVLTDLNGTRYVYHDAENGTTTGTLFAVVLKRSGAGDSVDEWHPVYGSDRAGYTVSDSGGLEAVIQAARTAWRDYGNNVFQTSASGMQVTLENLPGDIAQYAIYPNHTEPAEYTVAYYYTTAHSLDEATAENTYRVSGDGFLVQWGSTIEVPNMENRLYFQKQNKDGELLDGAVFALYEADGEYYAGGNALVKLVDGETAEVKDVGTGSYVIDPESGVITVTVGESEYTVTPVKMGVTGSGCVSQVGTGCFSRLTGGQYYLREIAAPTSYDLNATSVPVLVNSIGVYANAGTETDGVSVGNGVGYITKTLDVFASQGEIDETLTWVYAALLRNNTSDFSAFDGVTGDVIRVDAEASNTSWAFVRASGGDEGSAVTGQRSEALTAYLTYNGNGAAKAEGQIFDYAPNASRGTDTVLLFTTKGWSDLAIYQDYAYGAQHKSGNTSYADLTEYGNISNLFSSSTFVRVTDERSGTGTDAEYLLPYVEFDIPMTGSGGFRLWPFACAGLLLAAGMLAVTRPNRRKRRASKADFHF